MSKQLLLQKITSELESLGIPYQSGGDTDISVFKEFLDAGWSTGNKKTTYEAAIFADESSKTLFMWELTKEKGSGISAGAFAESTVQSGKTLYRKVKSVQYGPEGKVYEYTLDIGSISKAAKAAVKEQGWRFKTVIHKSKACYPAGYAGYVQAPQAKSAPAVGGYCSNCGSAISVGSGFCPNCGLPVSGQSALVAQPVIQQYPAQTETEEKRNKTGKTVAILLSVSSVFILVFFGIMKTPWLSWLLSIAVLGGFFLLARKIAANKTALAVVLWLVASVIILIIFFTSIPDSGSSSDSGSAVVTPAAQVSETNVPSAAPSAQVALKMEDVLAHALSETKQVWKSDAKISKVFTIFSSSDFGELKAFNTATDWNVSFFSPSSGTEIYAILRFEIPDSEGYPEIYYSCTTESANSVSSTGISPEELLANPSAKIDETLVDNAYFEEYAKMPDNMLSGSPMTPEEVAAAAYSKLSTLQNADGYGLSIYYADTMIVSGDEVDSAVWDFSWQNSGKSAHIVICPSNGKTYEY
ncbi:MAG: zinc ribbon domain-containing protein [Oscillospiraceae bacterium]